MFSLKTSIVLGVMCGSLSHVLSFESNNLVGRVQYQGVDGLLMSGSCGKEMLQGSIVQYWAYNIVVAQGSRVFCLS